MQTGDHVQDENKCKRKTKEKTMKFEINKANILNQGLKVLPDMVLLGGTEIDVAKLYKESQDTLRKQAAWLKQYADVTIQVEGHADERGTREYNIALSARRATATREFLVSQGIEANRISTIAYGKERPVALCDAEQCWTQNRRAVTVITGGARTS
jgi:peptidoglycan-associated lipoprotein